MLLLFFEMISLPFDEIVRGVLLDLFEEISNLEPIQIFSDELLMDVARSALCCSNSEVALKYINAAKAHIQHKETIDIRRAINMLYATQTPVSEEFLEKTREKGCGEIFLNEERKITKLEDSREQKPSRLSSKPVATTSSDRKRAGPRAKKAGPRAKRTGPRAKTGSSAIDHPGDDLASEGEETDDIQDTESYYEDDQERSRSQKAYEDHEMDYEYDSRTVASFEPSVSSDQQISPSKSQAERSSVVSGSSQKSHSSQSNDTLRGSNNADANTSITSKVTELALGGSSLLSILAGLPKYSDSFKNSNEVLEMFQSILGEVDETDLASQCQKRTQNPRAGQAVRLEKVVVLLQWCYNCITRNSFTTEFNAHTLPPTQTLGVEIRKLLDAMARSINLHHHPELGNLRRKIEADAAAFKRTDFVSSKVLKMVVSAADVFLYSSSPGDVRYSIDFPTSDVCPLPIPTHKLLETIALASRLNDSLSFVENFIEDANTTRAPNSVTNLRNVVEMIDVVMFIKTNRAIPFSQLPAVPFLHLATILQSILIFLNGMLGDKPPRLEQTQKNLSGVMKEYKDHKISHQTAKLVVQVILFGCMP